MKSIVHCSSGSTAQMKQNSVRSNNSQITFLSLPFHTTTGIKHVIKRYYSTGSAVPLDPAPSSVVATDSERLTVDARLPDVARKVVASSTDIQRKDTEDKQQGDRTTAREI